MIPSDILNKVINSSWEELITKIPDKSIDLLLTDPPYGMGYRSNHRRVKYEGIQNDTDLLWLPEWVKQAHRVCKDNSHAYIFCSWHNVDVFKQELSKYFNVKNILIWVKNNTGMGDLSGDYAPQYEMIIFCSNGKKKLNDGRDSNVISSPRTHNQNHPTEKPIPLLRFLIEKSTDIDDVVLDTFAGSFSTARAAIEIHRNFISCEIEKTHCNKAKKLFYGMSQSLF